MGLPQPSDARGLRPLRVSCHPQIAGSAPSSLRARPRSAHTEVTLLSVAACARACGRPPARAMGKAVEGSRANATCSACRLPIRFLVADRGDLSRIERYSSTKSSRGTQRRTPCRNRQDTFGRLRNQAVRRRSFRLGSDHTWVSQHPEASPVFHRVCGAFQPLAMPTGSRARRVRHRFAVPA